MPSSEIENRVQLIHAFTLAAELEHSLSCQYLFAAYSLKRDSNERLSAAQLARVRDWERVLLEIARQEMGHLGLVNNLLDAVGGAPHFRRPNFRVYPGFPTLKL